jgi:hypothetical protein
MRALAFARLASLVALLIVAAVYCGRILARRKTLDVRITFDADALTLDAVRALLVTEGVAVKQTPKISISRVGLHRHAQWTVTVYASNEERLRTALFELSKNPSVRSVAAAPTPQRSSV